MGNSMEPGYELDKAVAEACGIAHYVACKGIEMHASEVYRKAESGFCVRFVPSTDCNDAMLAAEKYGLFTTHGCVIGTYDNGDYRVVDEPEALCMDFTGNFGRHASFPACLSLAILALKAQVKSAGTGETE
jgi:hypothetical protein